jgi:hypothetical protein
LGERRPKVEDGLGGGSVLGGGGGGGETGEASGAAEGGRLRAVGAPSSSELEAAEREPLDDDEGRPCTAARGRAVGDKAVEFTVLTEPTLLGRDDGVNAPFSNGFISKPADGPARAACSWRRAAWAWKEPLVRPASCWQAAHAPLEMGLAAFWRRQAA